MTIKNYLDIKIEVKIKTILIMKHLIVGIILLINIYSAHAQNADIEPFVFIDDFCVALDRYGEKDVIFRIIQVAKNEILLTIAPKKQPGMVVAVQQLDFENHFILHIAFHSANLCKKDLDSLGAPIEAYHKCKKDLLININYLFCVPGA